MPSYNCVPKFFKKYSFNDWELFHPSISYELELNANIDKAMLLLELKMECGVLNNQSNSKSINMEELVTIGAASTILNPSKLYYGIKVWRANSTFVPTSSMERSIPLNSWWTRYYNIGGGVGGGGGRVGEGSASQRTIGGWKLKMRVESAISVVTTNC